MKKIVIANWKMNPLKVSIAERLISDIKKNIKKGTAEVVICPPFPYMSLLKSSKKPALGAQDVSYEKEGALTGEVSASMLQSVGAEYVIVGHSERRGMGETSEMVAKKALASIDSRLTPVICIGEKVRDGSAEHWQEIKWQLVDSLQGVSKTLIKKCIIAYEPVWAIGKKGKPMQAEDVNESIIFIRKILAEMFGPEIVKSVRIIYGGSVDDENAKDIMASPSVSGFLVGRASLNAKDFAKIVAACG